MTTTSTTTDASTTEDTTTSTTTGGPCNNDLVCDADEDAEDCLHDCGVCEEDGSCDGASETPYSCPADCPASGCNSDGMVDALTEQCDDGNAEDGDACTSECAHAVCGDGYLFTTENGGTEECDDGNVEDNDGCASDCTIEHRTVFVTSEKVEPSIGGLEGADAKCQELAEKAAVGGTFMAWLSVGGQNATGPSERFGISPEFSGVFELVDGTEIAVGWVDLVDGTLAHAIDIDETGVSMISSTVWTNTAISGVAQGSVDCDGWTTGDGLTKGFVGLSSQIDGLWTAHEDNNCGNSARLYCFQVQ
jgi:cysteine-rich repeat protein